MSNLLNISGYNSNPKSIFAKFASLRESLGSASYSNNEFVRLIAGVDYSLDHDCSVNVDGIIGSYDHDGNNIIITNTFTNESTNYDVVDIPDSLDEALPGTDLTLSDWFGTVSKSGDLYGALSSITAKFSYSSRMALTDINVILDRSEVQYSNINQDVRDLKDTLLQCSTNEGFVSARNWLLCLKEWFKRGEEGATAVSPSLDETKPFTLQAIFNLVAEQLLSTLATILSAIKTIFTAILSLVAGLLGQIFKSLYNSTQGVTVDHDAPNNFVSGPITYFEQSCTFQDVEHDFQIYYKESGSIVSFMWYNDTFDKVKFNSYFQPVYTAEYIYNWLSNISGIEINSYHVMDTLSSIVPVPDPDPNDASIIEYDNKRFMAAFCLDCMVRMLSFMSGLNQLIQSSSRYVISTNASNACTDVRTKRFASAAAYGALMMYNLSINNAWDQGISFNSLETAVHNLFESLSAEASDQLLPVTGTLNYLSDTYGHVWDYSEYGHTDQFIIPKNIGILYPFGEYSSYPWRMIDGSAGRTISYDVDTNRYLANLLPTSFMYTLDSVTNEQFVKLAIATAVVSTVAVIGYLTVSRAIRLKKIERSITRQNQIKTAKEAYELDPTKANLHAYAKAVDKYNRMGKVFGWGSYDAANDWVDTASRGSSQPSNVPFLDSIKTKAVESLAKATNAANNTDGLPASMQEVTGGLTTILTNYVKTTDLVSLVSKTYFDETIIELQKSIKQIKDLIKM